MDTIDKSEQEESNTASAPTMPDENQNDFLSSEPNNEGVLNSNKPYKVLARK